MLELITKPAPMAPGATLFRVMDDTLSPALDAGSILVTYPGLRRRGSRAVLPIDGGHAFVMRCPDDSAGALRVGAIFASDEDLGIS